jgi:hypothetical protein
VQSSNSYREVRSDLNSGFASTNPETSSRATDQNLSGFVNPNPETRFQRGVDCAELCLPS